MTASDRNAAWIRRLPAVGYALFVGGGLFLALRGEFAEASAMLWLAPIFDPFAAAGRWSERAWWMKAWLYVHVAVALAVTGLTFLPKP